MKAITLPDFGAPEVPALANVDEPQPAASDVVIDVVAAGVNRADVMQGMGEYAPPKGERDLPKLKVSGCIAAVGADVEGWQVGDEVCALFASGRARGQGRGARRSGVTRYRLCDGGRAV